MSGLECVTRDVLSEPIPATGTAGAYCAHMSDRLAAAIPQQLPFGTAGSRYLRDTERRAPAENAT